MRGARHFVAALAVTGALASMGPLAGGCSSGTTSPGGSDGDAAVPSPSPGSDGATSTPIGTGGSSHTPATGCREGFTACAAPAPGVCAHLQDDYAHCGSCEKSCSGGSCVAGACVATSQVCPFGAMCGADCIKNRASNVDHCGSCFNQCGSGANLCVGGQCVATEGNGSSCASPLLWDVEAEERAGFRLDFAGATPFVHPCGPLSPIPTKWFRFTAPKASTNVSVDSAVSTDKLVMTVFTSSACDQSVVLGCSADATEPSIDVPGAAGTTYFVAVGAVAVTPGAGATIRVDH
jgi:hypothetical protein